MATAVPERGDGEEGPGPDPERRSITLDLMERARGGDATAFDRLFARALPRLEWFVGLRLGCGLRARLEPQDVVQETYAAALPLLPEFQPRGEGAFVRWLLAIAENQVRRMVAHHGARRRSALRLTGPADAALALAADPASGPCTLAARIEQRSRVATAIGFLPEAEREALLLRIVQGRLLSEVAERMERSESAVRRLVVRATERLGRELADEEVSRG